MKSIQKFVRKFKREVWGKEGIGKNNRRDEHDQSTLYSVWESYNETPHFVQLIYDNKSSKQANYSLIKYSQKNKEK
jgi:hypothetical protein